MDDNMLEFAQSYEGVFKPKFEEKVDKFLDTMVQDSAVNVGENKATSDEYRGVLKEIDNLNATLNKHKGWRGFLIFCIVCLFAASIFFLIDAVLVDRITSFPVYVSWIVCAVCLAGGIGLIVHNQSTQQENPRRGRGAKRKEATCPKLVQQGNGTGCAATQFA